MTENKASLIDVSALQVYSRYREEGCDILNLNDNDLHEVDPFDNNLDKSIQEKIKAEVEINPWYFLLRCVKIPVTGGIASLKLTPHTYLILDSILKKRISFHSSIRMSLKTTSLAALARYFKIIGKSDTVICVHRKENVNLFKERVNSFVVPYFLNDMIVTSVVEYKDIHKRVESGDVSVVVIDEFEFIPSLKETHELLLKSVPVVSMSTTNPNLGEEDVQYLKDIYNKDVPLTSPKQLYKGVRYRSTFKSKDIKTQEELEHLARVLMSETIDHPELKTRND